MKRVYWFLPVVLILVMASSCGKSEVGVTTDKDIFVQQVLLANPIEVPFTFDTVAVADHEIFMPLQIVGLSTSTYVVVDGTKWSLSMLNDNGELLSSIAPIGLGPEEWVQVNAISANDSAISIIDSRQSRVVTVNVTTDSLIPLRAELFRVSETGSSHRVKFSVNMERANLRVNKEYIQNSSSTDTYKSIATVKPILPALKKLVMDDSTLYLHLAYFGADHNVILIHDIESDQTVHVKAPIGFNLFDAIGGTLYGTIPNITTQEPEIGILKVEV